MRIKRIFLGMLLLCFMASVASADEDIRIMFNGNQIDFQDAQPFSQDGVTMVPYDVISQVLGLEAIYIPESSVVLMHRYDDRLTLGFVDEENVVGVSLDYQSFEPYELGTKVVIASDIMYVPLRFTVETLGYSVNWDAETGSISIY